MSTHSDVMDRLRAMAAKPTPADLIPWGHPCNGQRVIRLTDLLPTDAHREFQATHRAAIAKIRRLRAVRRLKAAGRPHRKRDTEAEQKFQASMVKRQDRLDRLTKGFAFDIDGMKHSTSHPPAGAPQTKGFLDTKLRKHRSVNFELWSTFFPRTNITVGDDKGVVRKERWKSTAMDCAYIVMDPKRWTHIIVDIDGSFAVTTLRALLLKYLGADMQPNFIVGERIDEAGVEWIKNPHLLWLLPPNFAVWNDPLRRVRVNGKWVVTGDKNCRKDIINLWHTVHRGLIAKLLPIGADIGQLANPYKCKNPSAPWWTVIIPTEEWRPLSKLRARVDEVSTSFLIKESTRLKLAKGEDDDGSCNLWRLIGDWKSEILVAGHRLQPLDYRIALEGDLTAWLEAKIVAKATEIFGSVDDKLLAIIKAQAGFSADRWSATDPNGKDRGRDAGFIHDVAKERGRWLEKKERKAVGGAYSSIHRREQSIETLSRVISDVVPYLADPHDYRKHIIERCKGTIGKSTVYNGWVDALFHLAGHSKPVSSRYIESLTPAISSPSIEPEQVTSSALELVSIYLPAPAQTVPSIVADEPASPIIVISCSPATEAVGEPATSNPSLTQSFVVGHTGETAMSVFLNLPSRNADRPALGQATKAVETDQSTSSSGNAGSQKRVAAADVDLVFQRLERLSTKVICPEEAAPVMQDRSEQQPRTVRPTGPSPAGRVPLPACLKDGRRPDYLKLRQSPVTPVAG